MTGSDAFSGQLIAERYTVTDLLGRGGMGVVLKASDALLERDVALKLLNDGLRDNPEAERIFLTEARSMATLSHMNLVSVYDVISANDRTIMVTEFIEGRTLESVIQAHKKGLPEATVFQVGTQLCAAIAYLHSRKIIHRDLKPANVMLQSDGTLKLIDFGLARSLEHITMRGTDVRGTPAYMAPEQVLGKELSAATDIYQIGVTLYEAISGRLPFESGQIAYAHVHTDPPRLEELVPNIRADLAELIHACLAKDPAERPASAAVLAETLKTQHHTFSGMMGVGSSSRSDASAVTQNPQIQSSKKWWAAIAFLFIAILAAGAWLVNLQSDSPPEDASPAEATLNARPEPGEIAPPKPVAVEAISPGAEATAGAQRAAQEVVFNQVAAASIAAEVTAESIAENASALQANAPPTPTQRKPRQPKIDPAPSKKPPSPETTPEPTPERSATANPEPVENPPVAAKPDTPPEPKKTPLPPVETVLSPSPQEKSDLAAQKRKEAEEKKKSAKKLAQEPAKAPKKKPKANKKPPAPFGF